MDLQTSKSSQASDGYPDGYIVTIDEKGRCNIVPEFLMPATHQAWDVYQKRAELNVRNQEGGVSPIYYPP
jgi:hypothetical protein